MCQSDTVGMCVCEPKAGIVCIRSLALTSDTLALCVLHQVELTMPIPVLNELQGASSVCLLREPCLLGVRKRVKAGRLDGFV